MGEMLDALKQVSGVSKEIAKLPESGVGIQSNLSEKITKLSTSTNLKVPTAVSLLQRAINQDVPRGGYATSKDLSDADKLIDMGHQVLQEKFMEGAQRLQKNGFRNPEEALSTGVGVVQRGMGNEQLFKKLFPGKAWAKRDEITAGELIHKACDNLLNTSDATKNLPLQGQQKGESPSLGQIDEEWVLRTEKTPPLTYGVKRTAEQSAELKKQLQTQISQVSQSAHTLTKGAFGEQAKLIGALDGRQKAIIANPKVGYSDRQFFAVAAPTRPAFDDLTSLENEIGLPAGTLKATYLKKMDELVPKTNASVQEIHAKWQELQAKYPDAKNISDIAMREVMREKVLLFAGLDKNKLGEFSGSLKELLSKKDLKDEDITLWLLDGKLPEAGKLEKFGDWLHESKLGRTAEIGGRAFCFLVASNCLSFAACCHMVAFLMTGEDKYLSRLGHTIGDSVTLLGHPVKKIMQEFALDVGKKKELAIDLYLATGQGAWGKRSYERLSVSERLEKCNRVTELHKSGGFEASALNLRGISGLEQESLKSDFVTKEKGKLDTISASIHKSADELSKATALTDATNTKIDSLLKGGGKFTETEPTTTELYAHLHSQHPELQAELTLDALKKHLLEQPNPTGTAEQYTTDGINANLRTYLITLLAQNKATTTLEVSEAVSTAQPTLDLLSEPVRTTTVQKT